jgi:hypothetical protein
MVVKKKSTLASKVAKLTKLVKTEKPEVKQSFLTLAAISGYYVPTYGSTSCIQSLLDGVGSGSSLDQRVGSQIVIKKLHWRFQAAMQSGSSLTQSRGRMMIIEDKLSTGNLIPLLGDILYSGGTVNPMFAMINPYNRARFKILYDKIHKFSTFGSPANVTFGSVTKTWKYGHKVSYIAPAYASTGNILMLFVADPLVTGDAIIMNHYREIEYIDN